MMLVACSILCFHYIFTGECSDGQKCKGIIPAYVVVADWSIAKPTTKLIKFESTPKHHSNLTVCLVFLS